MRVDPHTGQVPLPREGSFHSALPRFALDIADRPPFSIVSGFAELYSSSVRNSTGTISAKGNRCSPQGS